jgi:hypothetical protein
VIRDADPDFVCRMSRSLTNKNGEQRHKSPFHEILHEVLELRCRTGITNPDFADGLNRAS